MIFDVRTFGRDYQRFLRLTSVLAKFPPLLAYKIAGLAGEIIGPLRSQERSYRDGLNAGGYLSEDWSRLWRRRVYDHGAFCVNAFIHQRWDYSWYRQHVTMDEIGLKAILAKGRGCLFLTYHHVFHHTLFCLLGLAGFPLNVLAAPEESSAIYDEIGSFISLLHQGCVHQFNGGKYLFVYSPRQGVQMIEESLKSGTILCSLNDVPSGQPPTEKNSFRLAGHLICVPNGSIRVARRLGVPIVAGGVVRDGLHYHLLFRELDASLPYHLVLQSYFDYLTEIINDRPDFWDGWTYFSDLAKIPLNEKSNHLQ